MKITNYAGNEVSFEIDQARDAKLTDFGKTTLYDRYTMKGETTQDLFGRVAGYFSDDDEMAQRTYDAMSNLWFMPSTPILSNGGTSRGLPISCFLNAVPDSMAGIRDIWAENVNLASNGGGIGTYWGGVREIEQPIKDRGTTSGIIPFIKVMDSLTLAVSQGSLRRGSAAVYLDISHPEIEEFLEIRKPSGSSDPRRKTLDLHHGIMIDDKFMIAVRDGTDYDLVSPHTGAVVKTVSARTLWMRLLELRMETGEPYIVWTDTVNRRVPDVYKAHGLKVRQSNLCVAPETLVLTDQGHQEISAIAGTKANVWNGFEFSEVDIVKTGEGQTLITVSLSDGAALDCTPFHKFYVAEGYTGKVKEVRAAALQPGMKLMKGELPVIEGGIDWEGAYYNGFYSGDGTLDRDGNQLIYFYGDKRPLAEGIHDAFDDMARVRLNSGGDRHIAVLPPNTMRPKFTVPHDGSLVTRLEWLAGLADSDGCLTRNGDTQSIQIANTEKEFLGQVRLMLQTLGVQAKVRVMHEARVTSMPDGKGGLADYDCKAVYRLMFGEGGIQQLLSLGFSPRRLKPVARTPQREASQFVTVESVVDNGRTDDTYCFTEPKRHLGVFNGILTGQCSEIALHTGIDHLGQDRTAVCCLASVNANTSKEWFGNRQFLKDVLVFQDNVLTDFINRASKIPGFEKAVYSATRERSIGVGMMGFVSFLQSQGIIYESAIGMAQNVRLWKWLALTGHDINTEVAAVRGACPDAADAGIMKRWTHMFAQAPTASISIICGGVSASHEHFAANVFIQKTLSGSFEVRNPVLHERLKWYADQKFDEYVEDSPEFREGVKADFVEEAWKWIGANDGSVQTLPFMTAHDKEVFKTWEETDQIWTVEYAAKRTPYICQMASNNLSLAPDIHKNDLHQIHMKMWRDGVPSAYYLRSSSLARGGKVGHTSGELPNATPAHDVRLVDRGEKVELVQPEPSNKYETCLACT